MPFRVWPRPTARSLPPRVQQASSFPPSAPRLISSPQACVWAVAHDASLSRACVRIPRSAQGSPVPRVKWGQTRSLHDDVRCAESRTPADHYWCHQQDHRDFHAFHAWVDPIEPPPFAERCIMEYCSDSSHYSALMLAALMIGVQRAISLVTRAASDCGPRFDLAGMSQPRSSRRLCTFSSSSALSSAAAPLNGTKVG